tara:strand:+ start:25 stop:234 length:210 start_codon:yes stop_codon:yes gene_type:complete
MLISRAQMNELISDQPKTKRRKMSKWVVRNMGQLEHTWDALEQLDDQAFRNFQALVKAVAKERNIDKSN